MKKSIILSVFALTVVFYGFSQENKTHLNNAPFIDIWPLFVGGLNDGFGITLGYEAAPLRQLSIVNSFTFLQYSTDINNQDINILTLGYKLRGRFYPLSSAVDKLFIGLGFNYTYVYGYGEIDNKKDGNIWEFAIDLGWKFIFIQGPFLEISCGYKPKIASDLDVEKISPTIPKPAWLEYGIALGWAF
ncbi:hypothetical protein FACS189450_04690 [Spirochaetia bacterium]|nr:hypothetical protein FACS189450_04690 [Spirochaetia bacterium]GHU95454.1 hypothetical protein FACS189479_09020 [Spirochaetia bacterium]